MALKIYSEPAAEPVSLAEMKLHLRVDISTDDDLITGLIKTARLDVETMSLHKLITQTWDLYLDGFPGRSGFELPHPPLQSVTGVYYTPLATGLEVEFSSSNYYVDAISEPGWIVLDESASWPSNELIGVNGVRVRFVCGYGAAGSNVDARLIQAMKLLAGHYYENREMVVVGQGGNVMLIPQTVSALCMDVRMKVKRF